MRISGMIHEENENKLRRAIRGKCVGFKVDRWPGCGAAWVTIYGIGILDYFRIRKSLQSL